LQTDLPEGFFIEGGVYRKRVCEIKLYDCSLNLKKEKLTVRKQEIYHSEILFNLMEIEERRMEFDYYTIIIFNRNKMARAENIGVLWKNYIERIRMKGKQSEKYFIDSFN